MTQKLNPVTIKLQMGLNRRMYETGKIPYDLYSKTNEILIGRLTNAEEHDIITLNEPQSGRTGVQRTRFSRGQVTWNY